MAEMKVPTKFDAAVADLKDLATLGVQLPAMDKIQTVLAEAQKGGVSNALIEAAEQAITEINIEQSQPAEGKPMDKAHAMANQRALIDLATIHRSGRGDLGTFDGTVAATRNYFFGFDKP